MWKKLGLTLMLLAGLLACQFISPGQVAEVLQTVAPTAIAVATQVEQMEATTPAASSPGAKPTAGASAEVRLPMDDENVHSFRNHQVWMIESNLLPQSPATVVEIWMERQEEPTPLSHLLLKAGIPLALKAEFYQTPDTIYMRSEENASWVTVGDTALVGEIAQAGFWQLVPIWFAQIMPSQGVPDEFAGQAVIHYHQELDKGLAAMAGFETDWVVEEAGIEGLTFQPHNIVVDAYVTPDGLLVGETIQAEGEWTLNGQTGTGKYIWKGEITDINADLGLTLPEEVQNTTSTTQAPLPLPANAKVQLAVSGMTLYLVPDMTIEGLIQFWAQDQGLTIVSQEGDVNTGMMVTVKKADGSLVQAILAVAPTGVQVTFP